MKQTARARHLMSREAYPMSVVKKMQFAMIVFACLACFSESLSAAPETIVNKKDLKVARKTAKTSEDHQRIANYYQEQAKKLQVKERKGRAGLANYCLTHPSMYGKQYPTPCESQGSRRLYHQAGTQALEKADQQVKMGEPAHTSNLQ